jgi:hypothetical protein
MPLKVSPGGSYFPYGYKGGELFGLHLGSFGRDEDGAIARMRAEERFFLQQNRSIGLWIDFCQTRLTARVIDEFVGFLEHTQDHILKLALVGCSLLDRWRLRAAIKRSSCLSSLPVRYYQDPEEAKTWLVSELG